MKICKKPILTLLIILFISLIAPHIAVAKTDNVIKDINDAAAFCLELPNGTANKAQGYCAYTKAESKKTCFVGSVGSAPKFSEDCNTFKLSEMVNKTKDYFRDEVARGGGQSTQPLDLGSGSPELDERLNQIVNLLSALIGIVVVASIIFGGIQYITAGGNSSQVTAAKQRISMSILSLILFMFAYTFLQWLIPGGIF